jgi:hypothetical protein
VREKKRGFRGRRFWRVGPGRQRRERGGRDTLSGLLVAGPRGDSSAGPNRSPWPFILFFFDFVSPFLFSEIRFVSKSFANWIQTRSNQFLNFCKIQINNTKQ